MVEECGTKWTNGRMTAVILYTEAGYCYCYSTVRVAYSYDRCRHLVSSFTFFIRTRASRRAQPIVFDVFTAAVTLPLSTYAVVTSTHKNLRLATILLLNKIYDRQRNSEFIKSLDAKSGTGAGVKFLTVSNVEVLTNELNRLLGSFTAGNNNVFNEISAITDELRRKRVLNIEHAKKIYRYLTGK